MPRLNKADTALVEEFGFSFEPVPEVTSTRVSKWDNVWAAAVKLCRQHPGNSLRVRSYNNASTAYSDAKAINNGESRYVDYQDGEGEKAWEAVAVKSEETYVDKHDKTQNKYNIYLTYNGVSEE